jgi:type II secretory pathway pseudopilin PulG
MMPGPLRSAAGFTYIAALFMVVVMGIMLGAAGQSMRVIMQREREKELIFRGLQYRDAIERWNRKGATPLLLDIKSLLKDPRSAAVERHLRQLYPDPLTGKEWRIIKDPQLGITGVASTSNDEPFKKDNFPEVIKDFKGKAKYSEWEFVFKKQGTTGAGIRTGTGTGTGTSTPSPQQLSLPLSVPEGN